MADNDRDFEDDMLALNIGCPRCKAEPRVHCQTAYGRWTLPHAKRVQSALRLFEAEQVLYRTQQLPKTLRKAWEAERHGPVLGVWDKAYAAAEREFGPKIAAEAKADMLEYMREQRT